jgi:hypothetical protein
MLLASGIGLIFGHGFPDNTGAQSILWVFLIAVGCLLPGKSCLRGMNQTPTCLLVFGQMVLLLYHPGHLLPTPASAASGRRFAQVVRLLATQGDVLSLDHGGFTQPHRFHRLALEAVLNKERKMPAALNTALRGKKYVVLLSDRYQPDTDALLRFLLRDYAPSESPNIGGPWVVSEPLTPPPGKRVFVLRPLSQ